MKEENKNICDNCGKNCKELVTREGFIMTYYIEWVCEKCFKKLEGISFDDFTVERLYDEEEE